MDEIHQEFADKVKELWDNCESNKYLKKHGIYAIDNSSLPFEKFLMLILCLQNDQSENLQIKFSFRINTNFKRSYLRYTIHLKGEFHSNEVFIQIPYNKENFLDGYLFTLLNIYINVNGIDYEMQKQQDELIKECYLNFITNNK